MSAKMAACLLLCITNIIQLKHRYAAYIRRLCSTRSVKIDSYESNCRTIAKKTTVNKEKRDEKKQRQKEKQTGQT